MTEHPTQRKLYIPKGGMCAACVNHPNRCAHLPFRTMPAIKEHADCIIVRCTEYKPSRAEGR